MAFERIIPTDIKFMYGNEKLNYVRKYLEDQTKLSLSEILLILALIGLENKKSLPLNSSDSKGEYTISRTVYSRNSIQLDTYYGLISILANTNENYNTVINDIAFAKNTGLNIRYVELINVKTFYSFFLGGIEYLYNVIDRLDKESNIAVFDSLYDYVMGGTEELDEAYNKIISLEENEASINENL